MQKKFLPATIIINIVDYSVEFDKELYFPGDLVRATFICTGPFNDNLRMIFFTLVSGETTKVTYSSGSGNTKSQSTAIEDTVYSEVLTEVSPDSITNIRETLEFTLPKRSYFPINEKMLQVYHQARIKFDIAKGRDGHASFDIPYEIIPEVSGYTTKPTPLPIGITSIGKGVYLSDEVLKLNFDPHQKLKIRGFRIEVIQQTERKAKRHKAKDSQKFKIATLPPDQKFPYSMILPRMKYPSIEGTNFKITHYVKLILDQAYTMDTRFEIPFQFYPGSLTDYMGYQNLESILSKLNEKDVCPECLSPKPKDGLFCEKCGFKIR